MSWKEFFKPTNGKIILTGILVGLAFLIMVFGRFFRYTDVPKQPIYISISEFFFLFGLSLDNILLIFLIPIIVYYIISCIVIQIIK